MNRARLDCVPECKLDVPPDQDKMDDAQAAGRGACTGTDEEADEDQRLCRFRPLRIVVGDKSGGGQDRDDLEETVTQRVQQRAVGVLRPKDQ